MNCKFKNWFTLLIPLIISTAVFFYVCGPRCLNPSNIAWLFDGDSAQHYLGWAFFRNSPWSFPIGMNPDWGLENSSSIIYADALPVFSILFKCLRSFLPEVFQFYGIWFYCCFILQAIFAWRLLSIFNINLTIKTVGTIIFTFSPIIFLRLYGHQSLTAHFLILWCLCLYYGSLGKRNSFEWMICLGLTVACHPYFSFMCLGIFGAFVCKEFSKKPNASTIFHLFLLCLLCFLSMLVTAWQIGLFVGSAAPSSDTGYGFYKFNLNGLINPFGQSYFLKTLPHGGGDYEGFAYLGLGLILFILINVTLDAANGFVQTKKFLNRSFYLVVFIFLLFLFSLSNNVSIGNLQVTLFEIRAGSFLQVFRSTGRFIWPLWYFLILYAFFVLQNLLNSKIISFKYSLVLLISILIIQFFDFHDYITNQFRPLMMTKNVQKWGLESKEWQVLRKKYDVIRLLNNPGLAYGKWRELSLIAVNNNMKTNVFYLARSDSNILNDRKKNDQALLRNHNFNKKTIYVLSDDDIKMIDNELKFPQVIKKIDGFNLLLPEGV